MDIFTKGALWDYWKMGSDEIEVSDDKSSDLEDYWSDKEEETAKILKIETDDIIGFKTYEDYKDDWIYEWNKNVPWVYDKPWLDNGIWKETKPVKHTCKPFNYKTGCSEWPTYLEWYEALEDSELKDEALRNKAIMEGSINDDESCNDCWKRWKSYEITYPDHNEIEYKNETHDERHKLCETNELPVCNMRRFKMIKYSFRQDEEYVAVKEDEYDDLVRTSEDACRAYQEIFRMLDEGWMLKGKFLDDLNNNAFSGTNGKDAVEHVEYFLKIVDPINLPNVSHDKLRVGVFPISLAGGARRWFDGIKESITWALWDYWKMGSDEIEVSDDKSSDLEDY
ncbi:hypothetical protein Tco_1418172 [Tanacetum coccineum]